MSENEPAARQPSLGVILTNYNHGAVIRRALTAITEQERHPDQLIIVDDGSRDNSVEVIKPFLKDSRVTLIQKPRNEGLASAVLTGLDALKADLVYFAASDDYVLPKFFERAIEAVVTHPDVAMIFGRLVQIEEFVSESRLGLADDGAPDWTGPLTPQDFFRRYYCRFGPMCNLSPATIYRTSALETIRYRDLLEKKVFDFVLDSFIVQIVGGRYPSYFIDADCAAWTLHEGGAVRFFQDPDRILKFVLTATKYLQQEPYLSSLAPEHFGLYLYGLWYRAINVGYVFAPMDLEGLYATAGNVARGDAIRRDPPSTSSVLVEAHGLLSRRLKAVGSERLLPKGLVGRVVLGIPKIVLGVSFRVHQAMIRFVRRGFAKKLLRLFFRLLPGRAGASAQKTRVSSGSQAASVLAQRERKTISALICNFNHAEHIAAAIDAVLAQTRQPDELLIMDDGSTDGSFEIIKPYADEYPWIRVFRREQNKGYISGISELTRIAKGGFIHRGASDDHMQPDFVAVTMEMAERHPTVGIVSTALTSCNQQTGYTSVLEVPWWGTGYKTRQEFLHDYLEVAAPTATLAPSTIFRKAVVEEVGGWREELDSWDVSFVLQAAALKYGMAYIDVPAYTWNYRAGAWTHLSNVYEARAIPVYRRYYGLMRSPEFRGLFGAKFPELWLRANLWNVAESVFNQIVIDKAA